MTSNWHPRSARQSLWSRRKSKVVGGQGIEVHGPVHEVGDHFPIFLYIYSKPILVSVVICTVSQCLSVIYRQISLDAWWGIPNHSFLLGIMMGRCRWGWWRNDGEDRTYVGTFSRWREWPAYRQWWWPRWGERWVQWSPELIASWSSGCQDSLIIMEWDSSRFSLYKLLQSGKWMCFQMDTPVLAQDRDTLISFI